MAIACFSTDAPYLPRRCAKACGSLKVRSHVGGDGGRTPRVGRELIGELDIRRAKALAEKIIQYYRTNAKERERMGVFIDRIGWEKFRQDILGESTAAGEAAA